MPEAMWCPATRLRRILPATRDRCRARRRSAAAIECRRRRGSFRGRKMNHTYRRLFGIGAAVVALAGCVQPPVAPMIPVAPGPNKSFEAFGVDQATCQQYAAAQTAPAVAAANNQAIGGTLLTTALGAGLGGAIGGRRGAAIGAAS